VPVTREYKSVGRPVGLTMLPTLVSYVESLTNPMYGSL
jgi:hypothetical protein